MEIYYQKFLENHLNGKHMKLSNGDITDITTDELHAEIKNWNCWKKAITQILLYNTVERRNKLQLYFFGNYPDDKKHDALKYLFQKNVFELFELSTIDDKIIITSLKKIVVNNEKHKINNIIKDEDYIINEKINIVKNEIIMMKEKIKKNPNYNCPCCNYNTPKKSAIIKHLYDLKKPCPKTFNNIELTDEIKEFILKNRIYNIMPNITMTQIINNQNIILDKLANLNITRDMDEEFKQTILPK